MVEYYNILAVDANDAVEPVVLDDAKEWLHVDFDADDAIITKMIKAAREAVEKLTTTALVKKNVTLDVETTLESERVRLPYGSVSALVVKDKDLETLTINDDYTLRGNHLSLNSSGFYSLAYVVNAQNVSEALKEAVLLEVAERYDNRGEGESNGISEAARAKAQPFAQAWLW